MSGSGGWRDGWGFQGGVRRRSGPGRHALVVVRPRGIRVLAIRPRGSAALAIRVRIAAA